MYCTVSTAHILSLFGSMFSCVLLGQFPISIPVCIVTLTRRPGYLHLVTGPWSPNFLTCYSVTTVTRLLRWGLKEWSPMLARQPLCQTAIHKFLTTNLPYLCLSKTFPFLETCITTSALLWFFHTRLKFLFGYNALMKYGFLSIFLTGRRCCFLSLYKFALERFNLKIPFTRSDGLLAK